ncbi:MAG: hypothetical protein Fur0024_2310 [Patescibacteria group bacterium]
MKIFGREKIIKSILSSNISNILFWGPEGAGKKFLVEFLAKSILCKNRKTDEFSPCEKCLSCKAFDGGTHPDYIFLEQSWDDDDETSMKFLRERANIYENSVKSPTLSSHIVLFLKSIDWITRDGQNYLLKFFEESKKDLVIFTTANEKSKLLKTIQSRFTNIFIGQVPFSNFPNKVSKEDYEENFGLPGRIFSKQKKYQFDDRSAKSWIEFLKKDREKTIKVFKNFADEIFKTKNFPLLIELLDLIEFLKQNGNVNLAISRFLIKKNV